MRRTAGSGDRRWLRDSRGDKVTTERDDDGAGSSEGKLTIFNLGKDSPMEGIIPAQMKEKSSHLEDLKNPTINGDPNSSEEVEDLDLEQGEDCKRRRTDGQVIGPITKELVMNEVDLEGHQLSATQSGLQIDAVVGSKNVLTVGLDFQARRQA